MSKPKIMKTGSPDLDADLKVLFELTTSGKKREILAAIKDRNRSEEEIRKVVPLPLMRVAYAVTDPKHFGMLLRDVSKKAHPILRQAQALAKRNFTAVVKHPAVLRILEAETKKNQTAADKPLLNLNAITRLSWIVEWAGKPPKLTPVVRVGFRDRRNNLLLDSTMEWDDALYLIEGLTDILAGQLEDGVDLAKAKLLNLSDAKFWSERIQQIQVNIRRILSLAPKYGIEESPARKREEKLAESGADKD